MHAYAGIGSRQTPKWALKLATFLGRHFASERYTLRSGGADGADMAFEKGCRELKGKMEIFLPWSGFNKNPSPLHSIPPKAFDLAIKYHPNPWVLKNNQAVWRLMARNCQQVLGAHLDDPVDFILCYTLEGRGEGGTAQALRIARDVGITIFDIGLDEIVEPPRKASPLLTERLAKFLTNLPVYDKSPE